MFWVCLLVLLPTSPSFCVFFPLHVHLSLTVHTQIRQAMMCAQLVSTEPSRKRVVYRSPVDTLIWIAFFLFRNLEFLLCRGHWGPTQHVWPRWKTNLSVLHPDWLTDWFTEWICHSAYCKAQSKILISYHTCSGPTPAYTICYKDSVPLVSLKCYSHASVLWKQ